MFCDTEAPFADSVGVVDTEALFSSAFVTLLLWFADVDLTPVLRDKEEALRLLFADLFGLCLACGLLLPLPLLAVDDLRLLLLAAVERVGELPLPSLVVGDLRLPLLAASEPSLASGAGELPFPLLALGDFPLPLLAAGVLLLRFLTFLRTLDNLDKAFMGRVLGDGRFGFNLEGSDSVELRCAFDPKEVSSLSFEEIGAFSGMVSRFLASLIFLARADVLRLRLRAAGFLLLLALCRRRISLGLLLLGTSLAGATRAFAFFCAGDLGCDFFFLEVPDVFLRFNLLLAGPRLLFADFNRVFESLIRPSVFFLELVFFGSLSSFSPIGTTLCWGILP